MKKPPVISAVLAALLTAEAHATKYSNIVLKRGYISSVTEALIAVDPASGTFNVGTRSTGHADFAWWPVAKPLPFGSFSFQAYGGFHGGVRVAVGDLDGDGADELIFTSEAHHQIVVYHGSPTAADAYRTSETH